MNNAHRSNSQARIDFQTVNEAALCRLPELVENWIPGGRREGVEYIAASLAGGAGRSFSANLSSGLWADFASGERGGDAVSLLAAVRGIRQGEAARELARELGLETGRPRRSAQAARDGERRRVVASYDYVGPAGELVFQVARWEPKSFSQRRPDGNGGWVPSVKGIELVPYRLPEVVAARFVFIVEGEKDADALAALGLTATCNAQGAGKFRAEYAPWFAGKRVCILPDNDDPGRKHADDVARKLLGIAEAVKILELPGLPPKGDVSDWLAGGGTRAELVAHAKAAPVWTPDAAPAPQDVADKPRDEPRRGDVPPPPPGAIVVAPGRLHLAVEEIERALSDPGLPEELRLFSQPGRAVKVVRSSALETENGITRQVQSPRVVEVNVNGLLDQVPRALAALGRSLVKFSRKTWGYEPCDLPRDYAAALLARDGAWLMARLIGFSEAPLLEKSTGEIVSAAGYDQASGVFIAAPEVTVAAAPARDDALRAVNELADLIEEFPFFEASDQAAGLAALMTAVLRPSLPFAPIVIVDGRAPGSGKSEFCNVLAALGTGRLADCVAASADPDENDKRLAASLLSQASMIFLDNVTRPVGSDLQAQAATQPTIKIRPFGKLVEVAIPNRAFIAVNGNGVQVRSDLGRRCLLIRLDAKMERPETRRFRRQPAAEIIASRPKFLAHILTVAKAFIRAGCPGADELEPLAGFSDWRRVVCGSLVWLGLSDPLGNRDALAAEDLDVVHLGELLAAWNAEFGQAPKTAAQVCATASVVESGALHEALAEVCGDARGNLDSRRLGYFLRTRRGRIVKGLLFERAGSGMHGTTWAVRRQA